MSTRRPTGIPGKKKADPKMPMPPDAAMVFMLGGALCKILELVLLRESFNRYYFSIIGGLLISIGSGIVTYSSIQAIRGKGPPVIEEEE